jgi:hypothetical protein
MLRNPNIPPAAGSARASWIDQAYGAGASSDPSNWAKAITEQLVCTPDGTPYESAPWPRQPKETRE